MNIYQDWLAHAKGSKVRLAAYACPACLQTVECPRPGNGEHPHDSLMMCPHCEHLHFKVVRSDGSVTLTEVPA